MQKASGNFYYYGKAPLTGLSALWAFEKDCCTYLLPIKQRRPTMVKQPGKPYHTWRPEHKRKKRPAGKRFRFPKTT
jgi:hypothetical protein